MARHGIPRKERKFMRFIVKGVAPHVGSGIGNDNRPFSWNNYVICCNVLDDSENGLRATAGVLCDRIIVPNKFDAIVIKNNLPVSKFEDLLNCEVVFYGLKRDQRGKYKAEAISVIAQNAKF